MKKYFNFVLTGTALVSILAACSKDTPSGGTPVDQTPATKTVTITATLPDATTRVTFNPAFEGTNPTGMSHTWQEGDKLRVIDANDPSDYKEYVIIDGIGTASGVFEGETVVADSYNVEAIPVGTFAVGEEQTQSKDGATDHLKYVAAATGVTDLTQIELTESSGIIGIIAKLPAGVAATINKLVIETSSDDFVTKSTLTVNLTDQEDMDTDDILKVYANVPAGWTTGTKMFLRFGSTNADHTVYTRYQEFAQASAPVSGQFNAFKMNCSNTDKYAGVADKGTQEAPYLIADPYQVAAVNDLATAGTIKYFKMISDVDMTGVSHNPINPDSPYDKVVSFDGNTKTISNLSTSLFYVFKGSVQNLTLADCSVGSKRGIFAEYCQGSGHTITNVDVVGGEMTGTSANSGALIGNINNGSDGATTATITDCQVTDTEVKGGSQTGGLIGNVAAGIVVENCTVSGTNVTGAGVVGGMIGFANSLVTISDSKYTGGTVSATARYCGGFLGSTANVASVISNCQVEDATVTSTHTDDERMGGFVGQLQTNCQIKGCTVGNSDKMVKVSTAQPASGKVLNAGGFVGVNYGTITKNGDVRSKAYVNVTSANTLGQPLDLGGFVGFHRGTIEYSDAIVDMSGLQGQYIGGFSGYSVQDAVAQYNAVVGSIKGNNYTGGFVGYVDSGNNIFTNNEVLSSTSVNGQSAVGGFAGYTKSGTFSDNIVAGTVTVRANNGGGFVGTTEDGTFTDCSSSAAVTGNGTVIGGFVGNAMVAKMTRCSSTGAVVKNSANGNNVGGFAGILETGTLDGCYATGSVTTTAVTSEYVGGFIGDLRPATDALASIQNCYSTGNVNGSGRWTGGFIGYIYRAADNCGSVEISKCYATGDVAVTGKSYVAGFIGRTYMVSGSHLTIEKCYATGNVSSNQSVASAFIGEIGEATTCTITDCYSTGNIIGSNQQRGGLIGVVNANAATSATISRCYSTSSLSDGSFRLGGLIGNIAGTNCSMDHSAAWNGAVIATSYAYNTNWSSGTIVGTAHPNCTLTDNYRNPDMETTMWWSPESDYNHPNVEGTTHPLVIRSNTTPYTYTEATATSLGAPYQFPYHGKVDAGKNLSQLASTTLGWSGDVWDFSNDLPTLK